jgi:hypothetical protein
MTRVILGPRAPVQIVNEGDGQIAATVYYDGPKSLLIVTDADTLIIKATSGRSRAPLIEGGT